VRGDLEKICPAANRPSANGCLIHLSFEAVFAALRKTLQSKIRYLLTIDLPNAPTNADIDGQPLAPPLNFPPARQLTDEFAKGTTAYQFGLSSVDGLRYAARIDDFSGSAT
jgi:hypothetical protein